MGPPIPPVNKVYTMLTQEEIRRLVGLDSLNPIDQSNSLPMAVRDDHKKFKAKDRQIRGHTVDTCYKIHGYPPGYKFKPNPQVNATEGSYNGGQSES